MKFGVPAVRYGIPGALVMVGFVCLFAAPAISPRRAGPCSRARVVAVLLLNTLFRIGAGGVKDRDREQEARDYFTEHGRWPEE